MQRRAFAGLAGLALAACTMTAPATFYDMANGAVYQLQFKQNGTGSGTFTGTLAEGEDFSGQYATVPEGTVSSGHVGGLVAGQAAGVSGSSATIETAQKGTAIGKGSAGTLLECDYVTTPSSHGSGACRDSNGRTYRIMF